MPISVFHMGDRNAKTRFQFRLETNGYRQFIMNNKSLAEIVKIYEDGKDNV
ncbi:hypothetical protein LPB87_02630 [Flavobacterium sp. EDS]|uniref:hypothetical protein n=1 Tax=Flavobacterium sp. EDS TaxID=2897328 RepID=UPI001E385219|nr:hypothetical protein [Flavobacterium sp. EDS]MCD0473282.1 hypothetical protein [Flavobacterium sp. EDS]